MSSRPSSGHHCPHFHVQSLAWTRPEPRLHLLHLCTLDLNNPLHLCELFSHEVTAAATAVATIMAERRVITTIVTIAASIAASIAAATIAATTVAEWRAV